MADNVVISAASAEGLLLLLSTQKSAYDDMIKLSETLRDGIVKCDADAVNGVLAKQRQQLTRIQNLETRREAVTQSIADEAGISAPELTLSYMAGRTETATGERLSALGAELTAVLKRQRELNDQNRSLMEMNLDIMSAVLAAISDSQQLNNTYSGKGVGGEERTGGNFFIRDV